MYRAQQNEGQAGEHEAGLHVGEQPTATGGGGGMYIGGGGGAIIIGGGGAIIIGGGGGGKLAVQHEGLQAGAQL